MLALASTDPEFRAMLVDRSSWGWELFWGGIFFSIVLAFLVTMVVIIVWHVPFPHRLD